MTSWRQEAIDAFKLRHNPKMVDSWVRSLLDDPVARVLAQRLVRGINLWWHLLPWHAKLWYRIRRVIR